MTSVCDATAAPIDIPFGDGVTYRMSPLREIDQAELLHWVRSQFVQTATQTTVDLPPEQRDAVVAQVVMKAALISEQSSEYLQMAVTLEGLAKLLELSFRQHHPEVTASMLLKKLANSPDFATELSRTFSTLHPGTKTARKKKRGTVPKLTAVEKKKRRKKRKTVR